jgi:tetratricopeptide (TPR) repeat protein
MPLSRLSVAGLSFLLAFSLAALPSAAQIPLPSDSPRPLPDHSLAPLPVVSVSPLTAPAAPAPEDASTNPQLPSTNELLKMSPADLESLGDRFRQQKDPQSARTCYLWAIRSHASAALWNKAAITELLLSRPYDATRSERKAVHLDKHMAEAWNNLGVSYYITGDLDSAIRHYRKAIKLSPLLASFHNNLAAALIDAHRYNEGIAEYRRAAQLDPSFADPDSSPTGISARMTSPADRAKFAFILARLFAGNGDLDRALHFLRRAIEDGYPKIDDVYQAPEFAKALKDERFQMLLKNRPVAIP